MATTRAGRMTLLREPVDVRQEKGDDQARDLIGVGETHLQDGSKDQATNTRRHSPEPALAWHGIP